MGRIYLEKAMAIAAYEIEKEKLQELQKEHQKLLRQLPRAQD